MPSAAHDAAQHDAASPTHSDETLACVIEAWPNLLEHARQTILGIVAAAQPAESVSMMQELAQAHQERRRELGAAGPSALSSRSSAAHRRA